MRWNIEVYRRGVICGPNMFIYRKFSANHFDQNMNPFCICGRDLMLCLLAAAKIISSIRYLTKNLNQKEVRRVDRFSILFDFPFTKLHHSFKLMYTTFSNGRLGSHNDEERSEMRYVMRIARSRESSKLWTHMALAGFVPESIVIWVSVDPSQPQGFCPKQRKPPWAGYGVCP